MKSSASRLCALTVFIFGLCLVTGFAQSTQPDATDALLKRDQAWSDVVHQDISVALSFWDADAIFYRAGQSTLTGIEQIREMIEYNRSHPGFSIVRTPVQAVVADAQDMGYTRGTYTRTWPDENGNVLEQSGNYLCIWRKKDGKWKCSTAMGTPASGVLTNQN